MVFTLPSTFPVVGLPLAAAMILNIWQGHVAMNLRKPAGVPYPNMYATDAEAKADPKKMQYNCAQRAHANTVENAPYLLALFGFLSVFHPVFASTSFMAWIVGRVGYTIGYSSGNPKKRINSISLASYLGIAGLFFGSIYVAGIKTYAQYF